MAASLLYGDDSGTYRRVAVDSSGQLKATIENAALTVALDAQNDSVQLYGVDGTTKTALACSGTGALAVADSALAAKIPMLGAAMSTMSLPVVLATDSSLVVSSGTNTLTAAAPASQEAHANLFSAAATAVVPGTDSAAINPAGRYISVFGTSSAAVDVKIQVSQDNFAWIDLPMASQSLGGSGEIYIECATSAAFIRAHVDGAATVTLTAASRQ
jgi:hypothetical protein